MNELPKLVTFDGEARSGKGTIAHATRDLLRDEYSRKVMLIDAGQVFRSLVVAATKFGLDVDDTESIDAFLSNDLQVDNAARIVKEVYHMTKEERNALLYTNEVSINSAKIGARPLAQAFKDSLLRKWLMDARTEGYDTVLLDGRALQEVGSRLQQEVLCEFVLGYYFVCDPVIGAMRTLGYSEQKYDELDDDIKAEVDEFAAEIDERNRKDRVREVQPIRPPKGVEPWLLPDEPPALTDYSHPILLVDTSRNMTKEDMVRPVAELTARIVLEK